MKTIKVFVVPHTHWDREWYFPFQKFRYLFIDMVSELLVLLKSRSDFSHFLLDGQSANVDDYLELKPEESELLKSYFKEGRLSTGPWYLLPDEFMVSSESLVRNLMLGKRIANELGQSQFEGYMPDSFGHTSQLPQILNGFNIRSIIFARGLGNEVDELQNEFIWEGPDGTQIFSHYLYYAYFTGSTIWTDHMKKMDSDELRRNLSINEIIATLLKRGSTQNVLILNGGDHLRPQADLPDIIAHWNKNLGPDFLFKLSSLSEWVKAVQDEQPELKIFTGEMRGGKRWEIFHGCLSSNIYVKQQNRIAEDNLEGWAEPISVFAWLEGKQYPKERLWEGWKKLIQNQAHDSIGGSCIHEVHKEMECRFNQVNQIAEMATESGLRYIGHRVAGVPNAFNLMVFNPTNWMTTAEVIAKIDPIGEERGYRFFGGRETLWDLEIEKFSLYDSNGKLVPFQIDGIKRRIKDVLDGCRVTEEMHIKFLAKDIPPYGYKIFSLKPIKQVSPAVPKNVNISKRTIENEYYSIEVQKDGSLHVRDKQSGQEYTGINSFEDSGDVGDLYIYCPPDNNKIVTSPVFVESKVIDDLGWKGTLEIKLTYNIPEEITEDRKQRKEQEVPFTISSRISLFSGIQRIDFQTEFNNNIKDHRLRVLFPTDFKTNTILADAPFDVVQRSFDQPDAEDWLEKPTPAKPHRLFLQMIDETNRRAFTLVAQGIPEYEVLPDRRTISLTLVRSVGWMGRTDVTKVRKQGIRNIPTPEAQCFRNFEYRYSLMPGNYTIEDAYRLASSFTIGLRSIQIGSNKENELSNMLSFLEIKPKKVIISGIKKAEDENGVILRLFNPELKESTVSLSCYRSIMEAISVSLEEKPDGKGGINFVDSRTLCISMPPKGIRTILIKFW